VKISVWKFGRVMAVFFEFANNTQFWQLFGSSECFYHRWYCWKFSVFCV